MAAELAEGMRLSHCMVAVDEMASAVLVQDPDGRHRVFAKQRRGLRTGHNRIGFNIWSLVVRLDGVNYIVPPSWVAPVPQNDAAAASNVLPFRRPGQVAAPC